MVLTFLFLGSSLSKHHISYLSLMIIYWTHATGCPLGIWMSSTERLLRAFSGDSQFITSNPEIAPLHLLLTREYFQRHYFLQLTLCIRTSLRSWEVFVANSFLRGIAGKIVIVSILHRAVNHSSAPSHIQTKLEKHSRKIPSWTMILEHWSNVTIKDVCSSRSVKRRRSWPVWVCWNAAWLDKHSLLCFLLIQPEIASRTARLLKTHW